MIIYGTEICKDCLAFKECLDANNVDYDFRDIGKDTRFLSEFMKLRDLNPAFEDIKGTGSIGIPAIVIDNENVTIDWENYLKSNGYNVLDKVSSCSVDGKGC